MTHRHLLETEASKLRMFFSQWSFKNIFKSTMTDSLYKNSILSMASTFVVGGLGFVFWMIIARLYKEENVGIATTLLSLVTLLSSFAILGLDANLIRHLPKSAKKNELINTSFVIITIASLLPSVIFFLGLQIFSPQLLFLRSNLFYILLFIIFTIFATWYQLVEGIFIAFRSISNILIKNIIGNIVQLILPFALIAFGSYGIFVSNASSLVLGVLVSLFILTLKFKIRPSILVDVSLVKEHSLYSLANYLAVFIRNTPALILPIIILNVISAKYVAYIYMAGKIQSVLFVIPVSAELILLSEVSHNETELKKHVKKAITIALVLLIPATLIIVLFGNIILQCFGKNYAIEAFQFLQLYSISTIFTAFLLIASAILNVKHKIKALVILNILGAVLTLGLSYAFISGRLVGIGWGWLLGQVIIGLVSIYFIVHNCSGTPPTLSVAIKVQGVLE